MHRDLLKRAKDTILKALSYQHESFGHKIGAIDVLREITEALARPSPEPDTHHPEIQALRSEKARKNLEIDIANQILDDPEYEPSGIDHDYWTVWHDKLYALTRKASSDSVVKHKNGDCEAHKNVRTDGPVCIVCLQNEIVKLRAELVKPLPEPVAWMTEDGRITTGSNAPEQFGKHWCIPLYAEPPAAEQKPLSDDELDEIESQGNFYILDNYDNYIFMYKDFARAVERKHGIKEQE
jgi:hypothetical protein